MKASQRFLDGRTLLSLLYFLTCLLVLQTTTATAADDDDDEEKPEIVYLLRDRHTKLNTDGSKTVRVHNVIEIKRKSAIEYVGDVSISYNDYYEKARLVKAFTKTPDGKSVPVSKNAVHDTMPPHFSKFQMYSDVRTLAFSMPALKVGAVIDYEIELTTKKPMMANAVWDHCYFDSYELVKQAHYTVEYPKSMKLKILPLNVDKTVKPKKSESGGTVTLNWTLKDVEKVKRESGMPPINDVRKRVCITSIPSWEEIQNWYIELLKGKQVVTPDMKKTVTKLTEDKKTLTDKIRALYLYMQKDIRYVGIELGRSNYTPHSADECFKNRYGDCKDQSNLLISLLKTINVNAYMALVRPNYDGKLLMDFPSPSQFSHVIVYVPLKDRVLWLDSTVKYLDIDQHPRGLDNVEALIIGCPDTVFKTIKPLSTEKDLKKTVYDVKLDHNGKCLIKEIYEYYGRAGDYARVSFESIDKEKREKDLKKNIEKMNGTNRFISLGNSDPLKLDQPFRHWIVYESDDFMAEHEGGFSTVISAKEIASPVNMEDWYDGDLKKARKRKFDWTKLYANAKETELNIDVPRGYTLIKDYSFSKKLAQGDISVKSELKDGKVHATARVDGKVTTIPARQWLRRKNETQRAIGRASATIFLIDEIEKLLIEKKPLVAEKQLETWIKENPNNPFFLHRMGKLYHKCSRLNKAREYYQKAIKLKPDEMSFYLDMAETYGGYTGTFGKGMDREKCLYWIKQAVKNVPQKKEANMVLAKILQLGDDGQFHTKGTQTDQSLKVLNELLKEKPDDTEILMAIAECNMGAKKYKEAEATYSKILEAKPDDIAANMGKWTCDAYLGNVDQTIDTVLGFCPSNETQFKELWRLAFKLMEDRQYKNAAVLADQAVSLVPNAPGIDKFATMVQSLSNKKPLDYSKYDDQSSPKATIITFMSALYFDNKAKLIDCFSPRLKFSKEEASSAGFLLNQYIGKDLSAAKDFILDLLNYEWEFNQRTMPGNIIDVTLTPPKSMEGILGTNNKITFKMQKDDKDQWKVCAMSMNRDVSEVIFLAKMASAYIEEKNLLMAVNFINLAMSTINSLPQKALGQFAEMKKLEELNYPDSQSRLYALTGAAIMHTDQYEKAIAYLQKALEKMPDNQELSRQLAIAFSVNENYKKATEILEKLVKTNPNDKQSKTILVNVYDKTEKFDKAKTIINHLIEQSPADISKRFLKLNILMAAEDYQNALNELNYLKVMMSKPIAYMKEITIQANLNNRKKVDEITEKVSTLKYGGALRNILASAYLTMNDRKHAIGQLECLLLDNPDDIRTMARLAQELIYFDDYAEAKSIIERARMVPIENSELRSFVTSLKIGLGYFEEAIKDYDAIKSFSRPESKVYSLLFRGLCNIMLNQKQDARKCFKEAMAAQKTENWPTPVLKYLNGKLSENELIKETEKAKTEWRKKHYLCETYFYTGIKALLDGKKQKAIEDFRKSEATNSYITTEGFLSKTLADRLSGKIDTSSAKRSKKTTE